jgi:hypothetical protein
MTESLSSAAEQLFAALAELRQKTCDVSYATVRIRWSWRCPRAARRRRGQRRAVVPDYVAP